MIGDGTRRRIAELTSIELAELLGMVEILALVRETNRKLDDLRRAVARNQEGIMTENRTTAELADDVRQLTAADAELAGQFSRFEGDFQALKDQIANLPTDRPLTQQEQDDINEAAAGAEATLAAIKARTAAIVTVDPAAPLVIGDGGTGQGSTVVLNPTDGGNATDNGGTPTNPVAENPNTPAVPLDPTDPSQPADPTDPLVPTNSTPSSTDPGNNPVVTDPTVTDPAGNPVTVDPAVDQGTTTNPGAASPTAGTPADPNVGTQSGDTGTSNAAGQDVGDGALPVTTSVLGPQPSSTDPSDTHGATGAGDLA